MMHATSENPLILLVDDTPSNLHLLAAALRDDYRIKTATNGLAALEIAARADRPELILLDMMMPEMDGIEVLRRLRDNNETCGIPVIFVTADDSEQSQLNGLELGADDYLTKPVVTAILQVRVRNLLQRKRTERELRLAGHVFNYSGEAIMITDRENRIIDVNAAFIRQTGFSLEDVRGENPRILSSGRTGREEYATMWQSLCDLNFWQGELWDRRKDGDVYPKLLTISVVRNLRGEVDFYIGSFTDISRQKAAEAEILHIANHDHLTGLPNRMYVQIALEQAITAARRQSTEVAVMFLDLDRFKLVNDTYGHGIGDGLLIEVGQRLKESVRECDLVARLGGDEFVVIMTNHLTTAGIVTVAQKILENLSLPYQIHGQMLNSSPSIGISLFPQDATEEEQLMKHADQAMYGVKQHGRGAFLFYSQLEVPA